MKKIFSLTFFFLLFFYIIKPQPALAAECLGIIFNPATITNIDQRFSVIVRDPGISPSRKVHVEVDDRAIHRQGDFFQTPVDFFVDSAGVLRVDNITPSETQSTTNTDKFRKGDYTLEVYVDGTGLWCASKFYVIEAGTGGVCQISLSSSPKNFETNSTITLKASGEISDTQNYTVRVKKDNVSGDVVSEWDNSGSDKCPLGSTLKKGFPLQRYSSKPGKAPQTYYVEIMNDCGDFPDRKCFATFNVPGGQTSGPVGNKNPTTTPVCKKSGNSNFLCATALGSISTDPTQIAKSIFTVFLGLSGGIAVLLIIISGLEMISSQGNPEKIQGARERLIAAIVGLLFIIFSFVILQVVVFDILRIPGFTP